MMTERFSPEYIDFVRKSETIQETMQAHWRKRGVLLGDWALVRSSRWDHPIDDYVMLITEDTGVGRGSVSSIESYWSEYPEGECYAWLPTLSDLLEMLEEAGWSWNAHHIPGNEGVPTWGYTVGAIRITDFWASDWDAVENSEVESDKELAAARLLARVLEGNDV